MFKVVKSLKLNCCSVSRGFRYHAGNTSSQPSGV